MRDHQPPDPVLDDVIEKPLQALLAIVHPGPEIGHDLIGPALRGAIGFKDLGLAFQIRLLVMGRHARISDRPAWIAMTGAALGSWLELGEVIAPPPALGDEVREELSALVPAPEGERRDAVCLRSLADGDKSFHHCEYI